MYRLFMASNSEFKNLTSYVDSETLSINSSNNYEESLMLDLVFSISDPNRNFVQNNMKINFSDGPNDGTTTDNLIFRGIVVNTIRRKEGPDRIRITVDCEGFESVLSRYLIGSSGTVTGISCGQYVKNLISQIGDIQQGVIENGSSLYKYSSFGNNIRATIDDLAEMSGFYWWIDLLNKLHFRKERPVELCDLCIDSSGVKVNRDKLVFNLELEEELNEYANQVLMLGATSVDGVQLFSFRKNDAEISRMAGLFGDGKFSVSITNSAIVDQNELNVACQNTLDKMSTRILKLNYSTHSKGHRAGEVIKVTLPEYGLSEADFFITEVGINSRSNETLVYNVNAYLKTGTVGVANTKKAWVDKFASLVNKNQLPSNLRPADLGGLNLLFTDKINVESFTTFYTSFDNSVNINDNIYTGVQNEDYVNFNEVISIESYNNHYTSFDNSVTVNDNINIDVV